METFFNGGKMKNLKVYGPGCAKCKKLNENALLAIQDSSMEVDYEYVTDMERMISAGIMMTPALEVDKKIVSTGRVLNSKEISAFLK